MNDATKNMIKEWVAKDGGDIERTARWMRDSLRIAGITECRKMILEALA